ncbi:MAG: hypothetical protein JWQ07_5234 [Ramlibacter sp.]|nr:hypothetical protein [Ramlibacter sp.]
MKPPVISLTDEVWISLCETELVRPSVVAVGLARIATNDWPPSLDVADAVLDWQARLPVTTS